MSNFANIPIGALKESTKEEICTKLNGEKIFPSDKGHLRDWRGFADLIGMNSEETNSIKKSDNPCGNVFKKWDKKYKDIYQPTFYYLQVILDELDRFDVQDDISPLLIRDAEEYMERVTANATAIKYVEQEGEYENITTDDQRRMDMGIEGKQNYDALLLYAEEDINNAVKVNDILIKRGLKVCIKERDLLPGVLEIAALRDLIQRSFRVVVILSNTFYESRLNAYLVNYAQAVGIEKNCRKIIPVTFENNLKRDLSICYNHILKARLNPNPFFNFEEKLYESVCPPNKFYKDYKMEVDVVNTEPSVVKQEEPMIKCDNIVEIPKLPDVPTHEPGKDTDKKKRSILKSVKNKLTKKSGGSSKSLEKVKLTA